MEKTVAIQKILAIALKHAPFEGWSDAMIDHAAQDAGYGAGEFVRFFPNGAETALNIWFRQADEAMRNVSLEGLKIREKISALILARMQYFYPNREALRRALSFNSLPQHLPASLKSLRDTVDVMWQLAGDNSADYNWYTKRLILGGVYSSTMAVWLNDDSANQENTKAFLARRIDNVMSIERVKQKIKTWFKAA